MFLAKGHIVNILGFVGETSSAGNTQHCHCSMKTAMDNLLNNNNNNKKAVGGHRFVSVKLYLQKQEAGWIWSMGT